MYKIHITEGVILESYSQGEVDSFYYVYTKEFGLIGVVGKGVKHQKSKLRYSMQPFSRVEIGFVKGKSAIRLTHAQILDKVSDISDQRFFVRVVERLKRLVKGEEKNEALYKHLLEALSFTKNSKQITREVRFGFEILFTVRLLYELGYWAKEITDEPFMNAPMDEKLVIEVYEKRNLFIPRIQKALEETQL